jgi:hypothetical protein
MDRADRAEQGNAVLARAAQQSCKRQASGASPLTSFQPDADKANCFQPGAVPCWSLAQSLALP